MAHYAILCAYFLLTSLTQVCSSGCGEVYVGQNPRERIMPEVKEINFTCSVTSSCNFTLYVKDHVNTLALIPANGFQQSANISIIGNDSIFTVIVKNAAYGTYYCGATIVVNNNTSVKVLGHGTQISSGGPSFEAITGIVFSILCAGVGMINKLL